MTHSYLYLLWFLTSNVIYMNCSKSQTPIVVTGTSKKSNGLYQSEAYCMVKLPIPLQRRQLHIDLTLAKNTSNINIINKNFFLKEMKGDIYFIQNLVSLQTNTDYMVTFNIEHTSKNLQGHCYGWISAIVNEMTTNFTDVATTPMEMSTIAQILRQTSSNLTMEITKSQSSTDSTYLTSFLSEESTDFPTSVSTNVPNTESHSFTSSSSVTTVPSISQDGAPSSTSISQDGALSSTSISQDGAPSSTTISQDGAPSSTSISHGSHFSESNTVDHSSSTLRFETVPAVSSMSEKAISVHHSMKDPSSTVHISTEGDTSELATMSNKYSTDRAEKTSSIGNTKGTQTTCVCACSTKLTNEELLQRKRQLVAELKIDKHVTKAALRRKQCADDNRKSSKTIGICGVIVLGLVAAIIIAFDLFNVLSAWMPTKTPIYV